MDLPSKPSAEAVKAQFTRACELHQVGRLTEAKSHYIEILDLTNSPLVYYNLGLVHYAEEDYDIALQCFGLAAEGMPEDTDCLFNLALCQRKLGNLTEAVETYQQVIGLNRSHIDAHYNIAACYRELKEYDKSITSYKQVLLLNPDHKSATSNIAYIYHLMGDLEASATHYNRLLELDPGNEAAKHMIASIGGMTPETTPQSYVREVFDNYSERYDQSLVEELQYQVPRKLRQHLQALPDVPKFFSQGIDLGCGTGLSGEAFTDLVEHLHGVDLSGKMVGIAKAKNIYEDLQVDSIDALLHSSTLNYDFILATDVFGYIGDLHEIFRLVSNRSAAGGYFCFSTEAEQGETYSLRPSGRFAHSPQYIRSLAKRYGWEIRLEETTNLRMDKGEWIAGTLWILCYGHGKLPG